LTTTLVGVLAEREVSVSPLEATVFALGIHEDTGSLTHTTTTQRDAEALGWCLRHGAEQDVLSRFLHTPLGETERELLSTLLDSLEAHEVAGVEVLVAAATASEYVEGISNLAHKLIDVTDSAGLAVLVEMGDRVFAVTRSRAPELDAAALAAVLGGGGHAQAASAIYRGSLDEARRLVVEHLGEAVREPAHARDVMSSPPRTIAPEETISRAMLACQRFGQSGILVAADDEAVGVVSREDLDKAISHGLSHAPVKGIMSSRVATCDEDTPLQQLQRLLAAGNERIAGREQREARGRRHAWGRTGGARRARHSGQASSRFARGRALHAGPARTCLRSRLRAQRDVRRRLPRRGHGAGHLARRTRF
jgi:tRNA nucleotidyltransferase (CCA-adding enzyme)